MYQFLEYLTSNELLNYPFTDNATLTNGTYVLPSNLLLDAVIYGKEPGTKVFLKQVSQDGFGLTFDFHYEPDVYIFTVSVLANEANVRTPITVNSVVEGEPFIGRFLFGSGLLELPFPISSEVFTPNDTALNPALVVPTSQLVSSLGIYENNFGVLLEDVRLRAGCNIKLENTTNGITISAGANEGEECACEDNSVPGYYITTIRGITGGETTANFAIEGSDCISVKAYPDLHMLVINDECRPCCEGCGDNSTSLGNTFLAYQSQIDALDTRITTLGG